MPTRSIAGLLAALFFTTLSFSALPCSLGQRQLTLQFDPGSSELGIRNAKALAEWFIQWHDGLGMDKITVVAPALKSSPALANKRMANVARILDGINTRSAAIVYEIEVRDDGFSDTRYLDSLDATVQPACLRLGTCCRQYKQVD